MADAPNAKGPWALDAGAEYRAVPGPHGPEELLWSARRRESFAHLDEALDALAYIAGQVEAKRQRVSGTVEIRHHGARLLYVPLGARGLTRVSPATAVERLDAIREAAGTLFAPVEAGPGRFRRGADPASAASQAGPTPAEGGEGGPARDDRNVGSCRVSFRFTWEVEEELDDAVAVDREFPVGDELVVTIDGSDESFVVRSVTSEPGERGGPALHVVELTQRLPAERAEAPPTVAPDGLPGPEPAPGPTRRVRFRAEWDEDVPKSAHLGEGARVERFGRTWDVLDVTTHRDDDYPGFMRHMRKYDESACLRLRDADDPPSPRT